MQGACNAIVVEEPARGDDLRLDREIPGPFHLAEIRRAARTHQGLQSALAAGAHDLDLEIAAAGGSAGVIGRAAGCQGAGVLPIENRKATGRWPEDANRLTPVLHDEEPVRPDATLLLGLIGTAGHRPAESVRGTLRRGSLPAQELAGNVEGRFDVELALVLPDFGECDVLSMPDEPGGLVVQ